MAKATANAVLLGLAGLAGGCGDPAVPERPAPYEFRARDGTVFRWPADRLPVRYFVAPAGVFAGYVQDALRGWEAQFLYGEFRAELMPDSLGADVLVILEGGAPPAASPSGTVPPPGTCPQAVTEFVPGPGTRLTGPPRVTLRWDADMDPTDVADCLIVQAAHELGHTLGILNESDGDDDLMNTNPRTGVPSPRDRATVQALYQTPLTLWPAERPQ